MFGYNTGIKTNRGGDLGDKPSLPLQQVRRVFLKIHEAPYSGWDTYYD